MKVLLDEQLSVHIAERLRRSGFDAIAVTERVDLIRQADQRLLEVGLIENRAVVTNNIRDFRPLAARRVVEGLGHAGIVLLPSRRHRTKSATVRIADAIASIMQAHPDGLANTERWLVIE